MPEIMNHLTIKRYERQINLLKREKVVLKIVVKEREG